LISDLFYRRANEWNCQSHRVCSYRHFQIICSLVLCLDERSQPCANALNRVITGKLTVLSASLIINFRVFLLVCRKCSLICNSLRLKYKYLLSRCILSILSSFCDNSLSKKSPILCERTMWNEINFSKLF
jgi:hypothetical protein